MKVLTVEGDNLSHEYSNNLCPTKQVARQNVDLIPIPFHLLSREDLNDSAIRICSEQGKSNEIVPENRHEM
jgi:hypothetical protein